MIIDKLLAVDYTVTIDKLLAVDYTVIIDVISCGLHSDN